MDRKIQQNIKLLIDYEKCFDKIDHIFLWQKLILENVSSKMTRANKAMYSVVPAVVKHNHETSERIDICNSV